jgi:hypothetical protein
MPKLENKATLLSMPKDARQSYSELFNKFTSQRKVAVEWVFIAIICGDGYHVEASVNPSRGPGDVSFWTALALSNQRKVAFGQGRTKREAKNVAARDGLKVLLGMDVSSTST